MQFCANPVGKGFMSYAPQCESIAWKASVHQLQCVAVDMTMAPPPSSSFEPWLRWLIRLTNVANEHSFGTGGVHWCTYNLKILKLLQGKPRSKISKRESTCGPHSDVQIGPCSLHSSEWFRGEQPFLHHLITCVQLADLSSACLWAFCCLSACQGRKNQCGFNYAPPPLESSEFDLRMYVAATSRRSQAPIYKP